MERIALAVEGCFRLIAEVHQRLLCGVWAPCSMWSVQGPKGKLRLEQEPAKGCQFGPGT